MFLYAALAAQPQPPAPVPPWQGPGGREFSQALQLWTLCNVYQATKRGLAPESPETVVAAAFEACADDEKNFRRALLVTNPEATQSLRDGMVDTIKQQHQKMLLQHVAGMRAADAPAKDSKR